MITFKNVAKFYDMRGSRRWILKGLSLEIPARCNLGILGPNGAGKSTLIRMIAGAEPPDFGSIERKGMISWPLGFGGSLGGDITGHDACVFIARLYNCEVEPILKFVWDFSELGAYFLEPVQTYSSGMRAKLLFGLTMAIDFDCYLVDEITAVGDSRFRAKCLEAFRARRRKSSVIMVSHSERTIREYCDTGAILVNGSLSLYNDLDEAIFLYNRMMNA